MSARLFLDERNLQQIGISETNIRFLRQMWNILGVEEVTNPIGALTTTGLLARTGDNAWSTRTITGPAAGITVTNGDGVAADPTFALSNDLAAVEGLSSTGIAVRTATDAWASRTLTAPAAGFSITNPAGVAGNPTFVLANDLASLEAASGTNTIYYRSAADTWSPVTIGSGLAFSGGTLSTSGVGTVTSVSVVTANGVSGSVANPTTTPAITLTLGAITPTSVAASSTVTGSNLSGTNTGDQVEASNAETWAGSSTVKFIGPNRFFAGEVPQTATSSATITLDGTNGLNFDIVLDTNTTLANPSNFQVGRSGRVRITQDGTGGHTMIFGANWRFPGGSPSLTAAATSIDVITFFVWASNFIIASMSNDYAAPSGTGNILLGGDMRDIFGDALLLGGDMTDGDDKVRIND